MAVLDPISWRTVLGFTESVLAVRYDTPKPVPPHHMEMWDLCTSDAPQVAIAAPRGSAKCAHEDSLVAMANGTRKRIADIVLGDSVVSMDAKLKQCIGKVTNTWDAGKKECLKISLQSGREIRVTPDHRLLGFGQWQPAKEFRLGDRIAVPRKLISTVKKEKIKNAEIIFLAHIFAEGGCTSRGVRYTNYDLETQYDFFAACLGLGFTYRPVTIRQEPKRGQFRIQGANPLVRENGLDCKSIVKRVPSKIFCASQRQIALFISRVFATDGWVSVSRGEAGITLATREGVTDLFHLLLRLGFNARLRERPNECHGALAVVIGGIDDMSRLHAIGILHKTHKLHKIISRLNRLGFQRSRRTTNIDTIPPQWREILNHSTHWFRGLGLRVDNKYSTSRNKLNEVAQLDDNKELQQLATSDIFWDKVKTITPIGLCRTYDIEVATTHNFMLDEVVSHNSTAITFAYVLASVLFEEHAHVLLISANEELASGFLNDIKVELQENEVLSTHPSLGIKRFIKDRETEIIVEKHNGFRFRIIVKGAEQRMRGLKWERKRPSMVIADDLEDEELVSSEMRREKFRRWFYGAVKPIIRDGGKIRVVGTIMHMDSLLMRLMPPLKSEFTIHTPLKITSTEDRAWKSVLYRAHDEDFKNLLWPEMYSEKRLRLIRKDFAEQGMLDVYGQEYLNDPIDQTTAYFRKDDFLPMKTEDFQRFKTFYCSGDLAITENKRSAFTALGAGGMDSDGVLHLEDVRRGRWDSLQISDEIFSLSRRFDPDTFRLEAENIQRSIGPFLYKRMNDEQHYINIDAKPPTKDKLARAQSIRARMRAGKVRFNKEAEWYADFEEELLHFPKWPYKDQVDMFAWMGLMLDDMVEAPTDEEWSDEEWEDEKENYEYTGVCNTTGY